MGTISPNFHNFNENSPPQIFSGLHENQNYQGYNLNNLTENSHPQNYLGFHEDSQQNFSTEISTLHLRPRRNSATRRIMENPTSFSTNTNTTSAATSAAIRQSQQRIDVKICKCGLEPVLREVKVDTPNKGRFFWSCSRYGGPDHSGKCNFFKWESLLHTTGESSSTALNTPSTFNDDDVNDDNNNDNSNNNLIVGDEIVTSPFNDNMCQNRASSQAPSNTSNGTSTNRTSIIRTTNPVVDSTTSALTGDIYTRRPAIFGNWENVPKYSTPQLLDILQNHLVQQDKNYQRWYTGTRLAKKDYDEAKKQVEKLTRELDIMKRNNELYQRENELLKGEKRLMEHENNVLKDENRELKRRH